MANCGSCKHFDKDEFPYNLPCRACGTGGFDCNGYHEGVIYYEPKENDNVQPHRKRRRKF